MTTSHKDIFSQRIKLPEEWAGETEKLKDISGVQTAILCHKGLFFARAETFEDIIKMCLLATKNYELEENKKTDKKRTRK